MPEGKKAIKEVSDKKKKHRIPTSRPGLRRNPVFFFLSETSLMDFFQFATQKKNKKKGKNSEKMADRRKVIKLK